MRFFLAAVPFLLISNTCCFASASLEADGDKPIALAKQLAPARGGTKMVVTSDAFVAGQQMDERFTQDGDNHSPPLSWTRGPSGTLSYAILVEDGGRQPVTHWVVYDIPGTIVRLAENQPKDAELSVGALQGLNMQKEVGFLGPKPPSGETHNYHVEVFALNTRVRLKPDETDRQHLVEVMKGHVLASGDLVVNYTGK